MALRFSVIFFSLLLFGCGDQKQSTPSTPAPEQNKKETSVSVYKLADSSSFGYDILINGKLYIHQPHVPAVSSIKGFRSESDAKKTAMVMVHKIENGISPPSVSIEELDSMKIVY